MLDVRKSFSRVSSARPSRVFVPLVACLFTASMVHAQAPTEVPPRVRALALKGAQFTFNEEGKATGVAMPPFTNSAMISSLMDVPTLESLSLRDIQLTKEDLLSIAHHPELHSVDLSLTEIGAEEIDALQEWKDLRALNLSRNDSVDDALVWNHVCNLDDLEWLDLSETRVTSLSYSKIGALTKLRYLSLANRRSRRRNLPSYYTLGPLPALEILDLHGDFTSSQLPMLVHLKSLRELRVPYGEISIPKLFALKKHMPKLHIAPHAIYPGSFTLDQEGFVVRAKASADILARLNAINELPRLKEAAVRFDAKISKLAQLEMLEISFARETVVPLDEWNDLASLKNLRSLSVVNGTISEDHIDVLRQLRLLACVDLFHTETPQRVAHKISTELPKIEVIGPYEP